MNISTHITSIQQAAMRWLRSDNMELKEAIERTVDEHLFSMPDIRHRVRVLKQKLEADQIQEWAHRSGLTDHQNAFGKKILALHAGNLPLVSFQTALGILLSGAEYHGKLSRKDPYLLPTFLDILRDDLQRISINRHIELHHFKGLKADHVVFAGSDDSVPEVRKAIQTLDAIEENGEFIVRSAKFSIAYITDEEPDTMRNLVEAMFRYGGRGCRSVAVVVAPFGLNELKCHFTDYVEEFWLRNPQHQKPNPDLAYQFAFNKAIGRNQAWLDDFLIQETDEVPELDFCSHWIKGDEHAVRELTHRWGTQIQSVYGTGNQINGVETELLSQAQNPNLWWKPDGVDVLQRLTRPPH
ncbi:MAG: hypothetical protein AAFW89_03000 [Bacteroidota bacterium]